MRAIIALGFLVAGVGGLVYGVGQLAGVADGSPAPFLAAGTVAALIGVVMIRAMSNGRSDAPIQPALGDHSLVDHQEPVTTTTRPPSSPTPRAVGGRRGILLFAALAILGSLGAVFGLLQTEEPNVAVHVSEACVEALRSREGPGASVGRVVSYDDLGSGLQEVAYETTQGWAWTCTYNTATRVAEASEVDRG